MEVVTSFPVELEIGGDDELETTDVEPLMPPGVDEELDDTVVSCNGSFGLRS